jgi:hypothetical protein
MSWTQQEDNIIKENFNKITLKQISELLPNKHGYYALRSRCQRTLGLYRDKSIIKLPSKNTYNLEYFKDLNLTTAYISGLIASDGCIFRIRGTNNYKFCYKVATKDECIIDFLIKEFNFNGKKVYTKQKSPDSDYISELVDVRLNCFDKNAEYLEKHYNLTPNKTMRLGPTNLTNTYLNWAFIIGNIDGDGTIASTYMKKKDHHSIYLHFCSASPHIIRWIKNLMDEYFPAKKYGFAGRIAEVGYHNQCHYYRYHICGLRAAIVINYLSQIPLPFKLKRKWENPEVLKYIDQKKLQHPHLFISPDPQKLSKLLPLNNLSSISQS